LGETDSESPILISLEMRRPDAVVAYSVWYSLRTTDQGGTEIVVIGEVRSESKVVSPTKTEATHYFAFYLPSQDVAPADGFPDEGQTPACTAPVPVHTVDTRMPAP
jgi:hypothetical protein